jgi:phage tail sheath gpL-like
MSAPVVVSPTVKVPGFYLRVNLLYGAVSPGTGTIKCLIVAPKNSSGNMTANTEVRVINSQDEAETAAGVGSLPALMYAAALKKDPTLKCSFLCPTASGGVAATRTITPNAGAGITTDGTIRVRISGRIIDVPWIVGETADNWKTKAIAAINKRTAEIHVTASSGGVGVVLLTAKIAGPHGNDIIVDADIIEGCAGGSVAAANVVVGTTEPDFTTALTYVAGSEYDYIALGQSNADANLGAACNGARLKTHINLYNTGLNAHLQQGVIGTSSSEASAKTGAVYLNDVAMETMLGIGLESLPCEIAAAEMGSRSYDRKTRGNANRIETDMSDALYPSADIIGDQPTNAEAIDALDNGVSLLHYDSLGVLRVMRAITTHSLDPNSNPDYRCLDCNEVDAMYDYAKDLRVALPTEFPQCKVARDRVQGDEELPEGVVEERDIKNFIVQRTDYWIKKGYINGEDFKAAVAAGELIVQVNSTDETQVDIFIPAKPFKNLSKIGVYLAKVG